MLDCHKAQMAATQNFRSWSRFQTHRRSIPQHTKTSETDPLDVYLILNFCCFAFLSQSWILIVWSFLSGPAFLIPAGDAGFCEQMSDVKLLDARTVLGASQRCMVWWIVTVFIKHIWQELETNGAMATYALKGRSWVCDFSAVELDEILQVSQGDFPVVPADCGDSAACSTLSGLCCLWVIAVSWSMQVLLDHTLLASPLHNSHFALHWLVFCGTTSNIYDFRS